MPRIGRRYQSTTYFHIIVQGINREYIFNKEEQLRRYEYLINVNAKQKNFKVLAYCIMSNHTHILVYTEDIKIMSKVMQKINTSYAKYYNKLRQRVGYVFRDRYYTQAIMDEVQLFNCLVYIHKNPVKAAIVRDSSEYKYSTYNQYMSKNGIVDDEVLKLIFGTSKNYLETYIEIHKQDEIEDIQDVIDEYESCEDILKEYSCNNQMCGTRIKKRQSDAK